MKALANLALGFVVVVAVALVMMPVPFGDQKGAAKATVCMSNVKQRSLALLAYASDGDERFPARDRWMDATASYLKPYAGGLWKGDSDPERWMKCPLMPEGVYGYAFNAAMALAMYPRLPETTPLIYDSVNPIRNASDLVASLPSPGRHHGRDNVGYADGHSKAVPIQPIVH